MSPRQRSPFKRIIKMGMILGTAGLVALTVVACCIVGFAVFVRPAESDCIIVLGCRLYGREPSPFLAGRLDEGFRLLREGYASKIIVSGGQGPDEDVSEAEAMMIYLIAKGCDPAAIICEDRSTSTIENLTFSKRMMEEHGLDTAIVVSNKYHLLRAALVAKRIGIETSYSGVFLSRHLSYEVNGFLREIAALIYTFFAG